MGTYKQDLLDGKIEDTRKELEGFKREVTSRRENKLGDVAKEQSRSHAANARAERKEAENTQAEFQALKMKLKQEGKLL